MAKFKDIHSGTVIEFVHQYDIDSMKGHPDYVAIDEEGHVVPEEVKEDYTIPLKAPTPVKRGRPSKKT